jgi:hypothetical protein
VSVLPSVLSIVHLIGLALAVGAATVKLLLLLACTRDASFLNVYIQTARIITRPIIAGMILLTLSGIGWLVIGFPYSPLLGVKVVLVAALWVLGPLIDNIVEPAFTKLAPERGGPSSPAFIRAQRQYVVTEVVATSLFYVIIIIWVW